MKVTFVVASFVGLIGRCSELDLPIDHPWHGHGPSDEECDASLPPPAADDDAGVDEDTCGPPGLYVDRWCKHLKRGVVPYAPSYELWADGADKERFISLPEAEQIDTSDPDRWTFPVGTRLFKTFSLHGKKLETRIFEKIAEPASFDSWTHVAYVWSKDQRSVTVVPDEGASDVLGTQHDVPAQAACRRCHERAGFDIVNGFEAIQLNHEGRGWTLERLIEQNRLVNPGAAPNVTLANARVPGAPVDRAALGYLNANCGNCHGGPSPSAKLDLSLHVGNTQLADAPAYKVAGACTKLGRWLGHDPFVFVIDPGSAATSGMIGRMQSRPPLAGPKDQMPPVGTELPDPEGIAHVSAWIDRLDTQCDPTAPTPTPMPTPVPTP